jgi:hypothetical protein
MQTLKDFCDFVYVEFKNILGHVKTWWLFLMPVFKRIVPSSCFMFLTNWEVSHCVDIF